MPQDLSSRRTWRGVRLPATAALMGMMLGLAAIVLAGVSLASWLAQPTRQPPLTTPKEAFDPSLGHLRTIDQIVAAARAEARSPAPADQVHALEEVLRQRFYHGYSRRGFHEDWMAWAAARLIHPHLDALVWPEEILRHQAAACSQQGIVVQAALRRMGIDHATVELPGHSLSAAWINGQWYMVDPWGPVERDRSRLHRLEDLMTMDGRSRLYLTDAERLRWDSLRFHPPRLTKVNSVAAPNAQLFHQITGWASRWLWLPVLAIALALQFGGCWILRRRPPLKALSA